MKQALVLLLWLVAPTGQAAQNIPSPNEVLLRAKANRGEFVRVVSEVEMVAVEIPNAVQLFPYIWILDELSEIGVSHKVNELGDPVPSLARILCRSAIKWINLQDTEDIYPWNSLGWGPDAFFERYYRWADDHARQAVADNNMQSLTLIDSPERLVEIHERTGNIIQWIRKSQSSAAVQNTYGELQGILIRKLFSLNASTPQIQAVLKSTYSQAALAEALSFLQQATYKTEVTAELNQILGWILLVGRNVRVTSTITPLSGYFLALPGDLTLLVLGKMLRDGSKPDSSLINDILETLLPGHYSSLVDILQNTFHEKQIPDEQLPFLDTLCRRAAPRIELLGLGEKWEQFSRFHKRIALQAKASQDAIEGSYEVQVGKGDTLKIGRMTVVHTGASNYIIGLHVRYPGSEHPVYLNWPFYHVSYNTDKNYYEAHHFALDSTMFPHSTHETYYMKVRFQKRPDNVHFQAKIFVGTQFISVDGVKDQSFPTFPELTKNSRKSVTGAYHGRIDGKYVVLFLSQVGNRMTGKIMFNRTLGPVWLIYGYFNSRRNSVLITSGDQDGQGFGQVRGVISDDGTTFKGIYLTSRYGKKLDLELTRYDVDDF